MVIALRRLKRKFGGIPALATKPDLNGTLGSVHCCASRQWSAFFSISMLFFHLLLGLPSYILFTPPVRLLNLNYCLHVGFCGMFWSWSKNARRISEGGSWDLKANYKSYVFYGVLNQEQGELWKNGRDFDTPLSKRSTAELADVLNFQISLLAFCYETLLRSS